MNAADHYREAEKLLYRAVLSLSPEPEYLAAAQVHATLALVVVDPELERRRAAVERAAGAVVACWSRSDGASLAELHDAVEALREYGPAEVVAAGGTS